MDTSHLRMRVICDGLEFPEGPVELPGGDILVTEIRAGRLTRVRPDGTKEVVAITGGGPNGAQIGPDGAIYVTQNGGFEWVERRMGDGSVRYMPGDQPADYIGGQIQRADITTGEVTTLYTECDGERLKGPNDLVFDAEGNFYFTDHGKSRGRVRDRVGVYYASPDGKMIKEIIYPMEAPNGCALSPDGRTLFVAETPTGRVWAFELAGPGEVKSRRVIGTVPGAPPSNLALCDSMCVDSEGSVVQATIVNGGITTIPVDGREPWFVPTGDWLTTNCAFGGPGLRTLYVTLSVAGQLVAFDDWPVAGHKLQYQA